MAFADVVKKTELFASENSTAILTGVAVTGTVTTAYLTGRASFRAADLIREHESVGGTAADRKERLKQHTQLTWKLYIPAVGMGSLTVTSIVLVNRLSSKKAAALAAAYGLSERAFQEYKEKVVEKLGESKETTIRDEIAQDRVNANPVDSREVIIVGGGEVLCYDSLTGRYFQSTIEAIKKAENKVNYDIINHMYASLSSFYDEIGLPATAYSDEVGWNINNPLSVTFSTTMSSDDRPCVVIDFRVSPTSGYGNIY